jgi:hypothetical protein
MRPFWEDLFTAPGDNERQTRVEMRVLRKHGRPLLLLPRERSAAAATLGLYPAQTLRGRIMKHLLKGLFQASLPAGTEAASVNLAPQNGFVRFLGSLISLPADEVPTLGVLLGNPATPGQRFLVLVFDRAQQPRMVVKAGVSALAKELVRKEADFLAAAPENVPGMPKLRATFMSDEIRALALDFCDGTSPRASHEAALPALLSSWVSPAQKIGLAEVPHWARLETVADSKELLTRIVSAVRDRGFHSTISHGDFAPWNIKLSSRGTWTVLDWERGELTGIPGWDWFHYQIQAGILVRRDSVSALIRKIEDLLASDPFRKYADHAGIAGAERALLLGYLLNCVEVIKPSEGLSQNRELLSALVTRWKFTEP